MLQRTLDVITEGRIASAAEAEPIHSLRIRDILSILRRRRFVMICTMAVMLGGAATLIATVQPFYTASSTVLIGVRPPRSNSVRNPT